MQEHEEREPSEPIQQTPLLRADLPELPDFSVSVDLLHRAQAGDNQALNDLLARYQDRLHRIVRIQLGAKLRRHYDSMDFVQEAFRAALPKIEELRPRSNASLLQWLALIALNRIRDANDRFNAAGRDQEREVEIDADEARAGIREKLIANESLPEIRAHKREVRQLLDEAVSRLPNDQMRVVVMKDYFGANWAEIAADLQRPTEHAARQLHQRAWINLRQALRPKLKGRG